MAMDAHLHPCAIDSLWQHTSDCPGGYFQQDLAEEGTPTLRIGRTGPWVGVWTERS